MNRCTVDVQFSFEQVHYFSGAIAHRVDIYDAFQFAVICEMYPLTTVHQYVCGIIVCPGFLISDVRDYVCSFLFLNV